MNETAEISLHAVKVFRFLERAAGWVTAKDVAAGAKVAGRTARAHLRRMTEQGLFDVAETFPGHRYRLSTKAEKRNKALLLRLRAAAEVFGVAA
jgi:predicted ArsR family transcriptional regulator